MTRRFAVYDPNNLGPNLVIKQSGEVIGVDNTGLNLSRVARGDIGVTAYQHYFEQVVWGEDVIEAVIGIVTSAASLSQAVGENANGIGYNFAAGTIRRGAATVATVGAASIDDIIGVYLELEGPAPGVTFFRNNVQLHFEPITPGATWYIGTSLGSDTEADLQAFLNSGQQTFKYPNALTAGWYSVDPEIDTQWIGSLDGITEPTDTPPNQRIEGVIPMSGAKLIVTRKLSFWPQGEGSATRPSVAVMPILDPTGNYDDLISGAVRDLPTTFWEWDNDQPFSTATVIGTYVVDRIEVDNDMAKRVIFKDGAAKLDNPLQRELFYPNVNPNAANRPWPVTLGFGLSVPVEFYDTTNRLAALHDDTILGLGYVRDRGDPLDLLVPDYYLTPDYRGIQLADNPDGKVTADLSSVGGDVPFPPVSLAPDLLASWSASSNVTQIGGEFRMADAVAGNAGTVQAYLKMTGILGAGKTYRYSITVNDMSRFFGSTGQITRLQFIRQIGAGLEPELSLGVSITKPEGATLPITYSGTFTNASAGTNDFIIAMVGTQSPADFIDIDDEIQLFEVVATDVTSETLLPIKLADFMYEVLQVRGGFGEQEWDRQSFAEIDDASDALGIGWHTRDQVTVRQPLEDTLPSYTACMAPDRNGVFRGYRMEDPVLLAADSPSLLMGEITREEMLSELQVDTDEARGLTLRFALRKNELVLDASDFVDDFTDVPLNVRNELSQAFRKEVSTGGAVSRAYPFARAAEPLETRYFLVEDAQRELDRIRAIYATERKLYTLDVPLDADYDLGQLWTLVYPRYGLDAGKPVIVWGIVENRIDRKCTLTLWG